jgi:hypothetical protein
MVGATPRIPNFAGLRVTAAEKKNRNDTCSLDQSPVPRIFLMQTPHTLSDTAWKTWGEWHLGLVEIAYNSTNAPKTYKKFNFVSSSMKGDERFGFPSKCMARMQSRARL